MSGVTWDLPRNSNLWTPKDIADFHRMPVQFAAQQAKKIGYWSRWAKKYASIPWKANMGDILYGIIAEPSPIVKQSHTPKNITETPNKTVVQQYERNNQTRVKRHNYESPLFHFLPSFRDFRKNLLGFATNDLNKQIGVADDNFVRWQVFNYSPTVYIVGSGLTEVVNGEATDSASPKTAAVLAALTGSIGSDNNGFLSFQQIVNARQACRDAVGMVPWEGMKATPAENEGIKGKYMLTGDAEIYEALSFDAHILNYKEYSRDLINSEFSGIIGGNVAFLAERYPLRMLEDGTFPAPEILRETTAGTYGPAKTYEVVPNPDYVNAPFGWAFMEGHQAYESVKVGPPPSEFAGKSISAGKFNKLDWNGKARLTDNVLVDYGAGVYDTNKYGEYCQLIADVTHAILPNTVRHVVPILYRRNRQFSLSV